MSLGRLGLPGACFAQVVKVPDEILRTPTAEAASAVHGIDSSEIAESHTFPTVWARFLEFVERCLNDHVQEDGESASDEEPAPPRMPDEPPALLVAAHNGYRAKGLRQCIVVAASSAQSSPAKPSLSGTNLTSPFCWPRLSGTSSPMSPFRRWFFADTLAILDQG